MITQENLKEVILPALGFSQSSPNIFERDYKNDAHIRVDFHKESIAYAPLDDRFKEGDYPRKDKPSCGFVIHRNTTTNFSSHENFVCLIAVHKLLEKGYHPKHIILEPTLKWGITNRFMGIF